MKKNVKCNLLKSLFLTGTVLTISACNKGDKNNANTELQNEIQSLKQQLNSSGQKIKKIKHKKDGIKKELDQYKEKARETEENDKKLLESIKTEISTLTTIDNTIDFSKGLDNIKVLLEQISSDDTKSEATEYFKEKIKFDFVEDEQDPDLINFKCGNLCIESINNNDSAFYSYCYFAKNIMKVVGCDDKYKIDLSQYSTLGWNIDFYCNLKIFPKEYFSTAKTFSFDIKGDQVFAGWENNTYDRNSIPTMEKLVTELFYICDINPDLVDQSFYTSNVSFLNVTYQDYGFFEFDFDSKSIKSINFSYLPITNFLLKSDFNSFEFDVNTKQILFLKSDGNPFWIQKLDNENFFYILQSKNIAIKNRPAIVLEANKICLKDALGGHYTFDTEKCNDLLYGFKILKNLKDCNFIDVEEVSLDFGGDENSLNLGNFDLLHFNFGKYYMNEGNVAYFLSLLFKLFDVDYTVKFDSDNNNIKLSTKGKTYLYGLDTSSGLLEKVKA